MPKRISQRTAAVQAKRRVALIAWSVSLTTLTALGVASFADQRMGGGVFFWGSIMAIYAVAGFVALIAAYVILEYSVQVWMARRLFRSRAWDSHRRRRNATTWI
jgi:hypothetical protein